MPIYTDAESLRELRRRAYIEEFGNRHMTGQKYVLTHEYVNESNRCGLRPAQSPGGWKSIRCPLPVGHTGLCFMSPQGSHWDRVMDKERYSIFSGGYGCCPLCETTHDSICKHGPLMIVRFITQEFYEEALKKDKWGIPRA